MEHKKINMSDTLTQVTLATLGGATINALPYQDINVSLSIVLQIIVAVTTLVGVFRSRREAKNKANKQ